MPAINNTPAIFNFSQSSVLCSDCGEGEFTIKIRNGIASAVCTSCGTAHNLNNAFDPIEDYECHCGSSDFKTVCADCDEEVVWTPQHQPVVSPVVQEQAPVVRAREAGWCNPELCPPSINTDVEVFAQRRSDQSRFNARAMMLANRTWIGIGDSIVVLWRPL